MSFELALINSSPLIEAQHQHLTGYLKFVRLIVSQFVLILCNNIVAFAHVYYFYSI